MNNDIQEEQTKQSLSTQSPVKESQKEDSEEEEEEFLFQFSNPISSIVIQKTITAYHSHQTEEIREIDMKESDLVNDKEIQDEQNFENIEHTDAKIDNQENCDYQNIPETVQNDKLLEKSAENIPESSVNNESEITMENSLNQSSENTELPINTNSMPQETLDTPAVTTNETEEYTQSECLREEIQEEAEEVLMETNELIDTVKDENTKPLDTEAIQDSPAKLAAEIIESTQEKNSPQLDNSPIIKSVKISPTTSPKTMSNLNNSPEINQSESSSGQMIKQNFIGDIKIETTQTQEVVISLIYCLALL